MLSITIPAQGLKPTSRRRAQVIQVNRSVKIAEFPAGGFHKVSREAFSGFRLTDRCFVTRSLKPLITAHYVSAI